MSQVQNSCGILVLLSGVWLRELYQQVLECNPLECLERNPTSKDEYKTVSWDFTFSI